MYKVIRLQSSITFPQSNCIRGSIYFQDGLVHKSRGGVGTHKTKNQVSIGCNHTHWLSTRSSGSNDCGLHVVGPASSRPRFFMEWSLSYAEMITHYSRFMSSAT